MNVEPGIKKILITEDDALMAEIYRDNFESEGFAVEVACDGIVAVNRLKENPPDLVLLDLMLPRMNGVEVLKFIRSQDSTRNLPVIVLSNAYLGSLGEEATRAGATKCLSKNGFGPKRLMEEVRNALALTSAQPISGTTSGNPIVEPPVPSKNGGGFQVALRQDTIKKMPQRMAEMRQLLLKLGKSGAATYLSDLLELHRSVHGLTNSVILAELMQMAQMSSALEALVKEIHAKPQRLNPSSLRTIAQAIDLLTLLSQHAEVAQKDAMFSPLILVVDDEPISRETICMALEQAQLHAVSIDDPVLALKLLEENRFDLIFLDVQMPGLNGFEVCTKLHATPANPTTPVVFVTGLTDFETRARSTLSGGADIIAKPIMLMELAVKALTHLLRAQCKPAA